MEIMTKDHLKVTMLRAGKVFEGTTAEIIEMISKQIDEDLKHDRNTSTD